MSWALGAERSILMLMWAVGDPSTENAGLRLLGLRCPPGSGTALDAQSSNCTSQVWTPNSGQMPKQKQVCSSIQWSRIHCLAASTCNKSILPYSFSTQAAVGISKKTARTTLPLSALLRDRCESASRKGDCFEPSRAQSLASL